MLRAELLPMSDAGWSAIAGEIRATIARRVDDPALVDDLVQEALVRVHARQDQLRDDERISAWVGRIARNIVVDHHRRRRPTVPLPDTLTQPLAQSWSDAGGERERIDTAPLARWLSSALARLPETYRDVLTCTELRGLTQRATAEHLGLSLSATKSRVLRGRALLADQLHACCAIELDRRGGLVDYTGKPGCC